MALLSGASPMQVCAYSEYRFSKFSHAFTALRNMGLGGKIFGTPDGLELAKPMGAGSGNGFSIFPDFKRFAFFSVWENRSAAEQFFAESKLIHTYTERARSGLHALLKPVRVHGLWGGGSPLRPSEPSGGTVPVAVLTRATIRPRKLPDFWMNVPDVSSFMADADGVLYKLGVGEYPLFMQATFSIWESAELLNRAAYGKNKAHAEVVRKTRERDWYAEEMFARFEVLDLKTLGEPHVGLSRHFSG